MPSGRTRSRLNAVRPIFFLDRGLGVHFVAEAIRRRGYEVLPMAEIYPSGADQSVADDEWIQRASKEDWIALTKDYSITRGHENALAHLPCECLR